MSAAQRLGVVIAAAGSGVRFGDTSKSLAPLGGRPLLAWSLSMFSSLPDTCEIVVVAGNHTLHGCEELIAAMGLSHVGVIHGRETRSDSVRVGLHALRSACSYVAIHDAARPLASLGLARRVMDAAMAAGAAVPVVPVSDTLHVISSESTIESSPDRARLRAAQTPQVARREWLVDAYEGNVETTDEGGVLHAAGYSVTLVDGDPNNLKITWPSDLIVAEAIVAASAEGR